MITALLVIICIAIAAGIIWLIFTKDKVVARTWGIVGLSFIIGLTVFGYFFMQSRQMMQSGLTVKRKLSATVFHR